MFRRLTTKHTHGPRNSSQNAAAPKDALDEPWWIQYNLDLEKQSREDKLNSSSSEVQTLQKWFEAAKYPIPSTHNILAALKSPFSNGDLDTAFYLIRYYQLCNSGLFLTNSTQDKAGHTILFQGSENWENVMCYLDALLFSMFANLESFEPILFISNQHSDPLVDKLASLLRTYVSLLRSGNLITVDITEQLCQLLSKLGFTEAMSHRQQDAATLFEFLTQTLSMPLLTFKVDIKHGGKHDKDDQKISKERILFVSIPEEDQAEEGNEDILLEECLEHYFNNSISVRRELERRATLEYGAPMDPGSVEVVGSPLETDGIHAIPECPSPSSSPDFKSPIPFPKYQESAVKESVPQFPSPPPVSHSDSSKINYRLNTRTRSSTLTIWSLASNTDQPKKEVTLPAWMFLRLLPFYTDDNNIDGSTKNSKDFVNRRPVLPICLKRYSYNTSDSSAARSKKRIQIPPVIDLPRFVAEDASEADHKFKLILESAICHRGTSISSGHFVAAVRKNFKNDYDGYDSPWLLYDDMKKNGRVVEKSFKKIFDTEWPYMLFYRLVSDEETLSSNSSVKTPVLAPQGSKSKYWKELEKIPKSEQTPLSPIQSVNASSLDENVSTNPLNHSSLSTPLPEFSPNDARYVDIRDKYFWYVTDKDKNYYKEIPITSTHGSRGPSISISPQFRRNSQWSDKSIHSVNVAQITKSVNESDTSTLHKPRSLNEDVEKEVERVKDEGKHHRHLRSRHRKRREAYKRDKCVVV